MAAAVSCGISRNGLKKKESDMTKEQIEKAAMEFAEREYEISDIDKIPLYKGFFHGAQWRINSVWHDAEEEPKQNAWFIAQIGDGAFDTFIMSIESTRWDRWCNGLNIKRWAYIEDLLPERKEETNG